MTTVLVVEDDRHLLEAVCATLELAGISALGAGDGGTALELLSARNIGLVLSDVGMAPMGGLELLVEVRRRRPDLPVVLMTAYGVVEQAVEAMRAGAVDYLTKPIEADALIALARRLLTAAPAPPPSGFIAEDVLTLELLRLAARVAQSSATVLLTGESGSGKEMFARYVHTSSPRASGPFVAINCAAIPENLLEATLFGHERGAFTGAAQSQAGKFEQANGGTLLLDEISEMPLALQAKLLRVLQEREVERVGGKKPVALDVRVLATSNRDLEAEVHAGRFREDLYYRINVFPLHMPALRERRRDILPLARAVLARAAKGRPGRLFTLSPEAETRLTSYTWKGNIRELENVMQRAMILASGSSIEAEHLCLPADGGRGAAAGGEAAAAAGIAAPVAVKSAPTDLKSLERAHILDTLAAVKGVRKAAAERLGMSERTLRYKLAQYRLEDAAGKGEGR